MRPQSASLFDFYEPLPIRVEVSDAPLTSDAGLLPLRQFDQRIGLAGAENPELLLARERVTEALAVRQLAAAQLLPNLTLGTNYDSHRGVLQQASGNILKTNRDALYVGMPASDRGWVR